MTELYSSLQRDSFILYCKGTELYFFVCAKGQRCTLDHKGTELYSSPQRNTALVFMVKGQNFSLPGRGTELYSSLQWDRNLLFIKGHSLILHCKSDRNLLFIAMGQRSFPHCKRTELHCSLQRDRAAFLIAKRQSSILHCSETELYSPLQVDSFILHHIRERGMTVNQFLVVSSSSGSCCSCCQLREDCSNIRSKRSFAS